MFVTDSERLRKESDLGSVEVAAERVVHTTRKITAFDVCALGICATIGRLMQRWNYGFENGFGNFAVGLAIVSLAYYCLVLCLAELSSGLPFAGTDLFHL